MPDFINAAVRSRTTQAALVGLGTALIEIHRWWWTKTNLQGDFGSYYCHRIEKKLRSGRLHPTLVAGPGVGRTSLGRRSGRQLPKGGRRVFELLKQLGLNRGSSCVDYGCGSLRIGRYLINYLDPGRYLGLDIVDSFYREGRKLLGEELIAAKAPRFAVIDDAVIAEEARRAPDFLFSNAVVQHVPPWALERFFRMIASLTGAGTLSCVLFVSDREDRRIAPLSWSYRPDTLAAAARDADPGLSVSLRLLNAAADDRRGRERHALLLTRRTS